jgi:ribosome-associated toxin RatA of RatAB toxin-antitoxin module
MDSIKFSEKILIQANAETVFDYSQDYDKRLIWDTFLIKADLMDGATKAEKGVKAYCVAKNRVGMITEYVSFNRPKATAIKMTKGPYLFKTFLGSWTFKEINEKETEVIFLYSFSLRFPFKLVSNYIKNNLQNNVKLRLIDLKQNIEILNSKNEILNSKN